MEYSCPMTDDRTLLAFFDALVRCETELWNRADASARRAGTPSLGSLSAMRIIHRHGGAGRVQEIADELVITVGAASKIVDRLVRDGLAVRLPHPVDRRSSLLELTDAGGSALRDGEDALAGSLRESVGDAIDTVELMSLARVLERLAGR